MPKKHPLHREYVTEISLLPLHEWDSFPSFKEWLASKKKRGE